MVTKWNIGFGALAHFLFGFFGIIYGCPWYFLVIFLISQGIDLAFGEKHGVTKGDIAEFAAGAVFAFILQSFLGILEVLI